MSATVYIDGEAVTVVGQRNLLELALEQGADLPYFCWHPELGSVGACRQCAVRHYADEDDDEGQIVMACMTPASDGCRVEVDDPEAREMRAAVIEWLMVNHPHDCPVCDEGGECHLQDMTVMAGHVRRRRHFDKRTHRNQDLGPLINHEMNRCIQCYRCVRFYDDYAGGHDLQALGAHDHVYFGRTEDGQLESPFSGNLIEVCPTGVFTDAVEKKRFVRKWDLQTAPSVCVHCSVGCNITPGECDGELRRVRNRYHAQINGYFLCDRGRYGPGHVESGARILRTRGEALDATEPEAARQALQGLLAEATASGKVVAVGSPRASLEDNFALRAKVGAEHFFDGATGRDGELVARAIELHEQSQPPGQAQGRTRPVAPRELASCDAVFVVGEDVWNTAPIVALSLRRAAEVAPRREVVDRGVPPWHARAVADGVQGRPGPLFIVTSTGSPLDEAACASWRDDPTGIARLARAVAHRLAPEGHPAPGELDEAQWSLATEIADALRASRRPAVVSGVGAGTAAVLEAAAAVAHALADARPVAEPTRLMLVLPESNSAGLALLGARPRTDLESVVDEDTTLIVLHNDLRARLGPAMAERVCARAGRVVVFDHLEHWTTERADLVLPVPTFIEAHGHRVNLEGRVQRCVRVAPPPPGVLPAWQWIEPGLEGIETVHARLEAAHPRFQDAFDTVGGGSIARKTHRATGRTARRVHLRIKESPPPTDLDSPYRHSMEEDGLPRPARMRAYYRAPGWTSEQALNRFQEEIGGPLRGGDPGVLLFDPGRAAGRGEAVSDRRGRSGLAEPVTLADAEVNRGGSAERLRWLPTWPGVGAEPLSRRAAALASRIPAPRIRLHPDDARDRAVDEGSLVCIETGQDRASVVASVDHEVPRGWVAAPRGLIDLVVNTGARVSVDLERASPTSTGGPA